MNRIRVKPDKLESRLTGQKLCKKRILMNRFQWKNHSICRIVFDNDRRGQFFWKPRQFLKYFNFSKIKIIFFSSGKSYLLPQFLSLEKKKIFLETSYQYKKLLVITFLIYVPKRLSKIIKHWRRKFYQKTPFFVTFSWIKKVFGLILDDFCIDLMFQKLFSFFLQFWADGLIFYLSECYTLYTIHL